MNDYGGQSGSRTPRENGPQNNLNEVQKGSQRLKWQSLSLNGSVIGTLYIRACC